jgi:peptide/nickel transport system substrate-binding protein
MQEIFEYRFTKLDPIGGDHIDPPSVAVYETLMVKGPGERPQPGLARSWVVSDDGLRWRLSLRPGARFHSGDACDAPAVVAALDRCRWGDGRTRQLWYWDPVDVVVALDETTIELRLHHPYLRLPTLLWGTHTAICNVARRDELGDEFGVKLADGTGPYRLVSFSPEEVVAQLATTPGVAPAAPGAPPSIRWRSRTLEAERRVELAAGSAEVVRAVDPRWVDDAAAGRWRFVAQPEISQLYLALRFDDPLGFSDLRLRRAIEAFVDRQRLVDAAFAGRGDGRRSPVPLGDRFASSFDPASSRPMSPAEAEATLDGLGFVRGEDGVRRREGEELRLDCVTQDAEPFRRLAGELTTQLLRGGVAIEFRYVEPFEAFYRAVESGPQSFLSKWLWQDAIEAAMGFSRSSCAGEGGLPPTGGANWQGARLPALDKAYDRYLQAASDDDLVAASSEVQRVFVEELPYIPLCSPTETYAVGGGVEGFSPVPGTLYPLYATVSTTRG